MQVREGVDALLTELAPYDARNIGVIGAFGVGGYIALAGLWGSPISGASMNPARTFGRDLVSRTFTDYWVSVAGPSRVLRSQSSLRSSSANGAEADPGRVRHRATSSPRPTRKGAESELAPRSSRGTPGAVEHIRPRHPIK